MELLGTVSLIFQVNYLGETFYLTSFNHSLFVVPLPPSMLRHLQIFVNQLKCNPEALKLKRPLFCIHKVNLRFLVPQTLSLFRSRRAEQWYGDGKERQNLKCPCKAHLQVCYFSYGFLLERLLIPRRHLFSPAIWSINCFNVYIAVWKYCAAQTITQHGSFGHISIAVKITELYFVVWTLPSE